MALNRFTARSVAAAIAAFGILAGAASIAAAAYPDKPITLVVPYGPGGGTDLTARILGSEMQKVLGQPVVVENRGAGGGAVALGQLYAAKPDGYVIAVGTGSNTTIIPHMTNVAYEPLKFSYIGSYFAWPYMIVISSKLPVKNVAELIAWAKANPDGLIVSTTGGFNIHEVSMALLAEKGGGLRYRSLPSNSAAESTARVLAGDANITFGSPATYLEHVKAGTLRALAIVSDVVGPELEGLGLEKTESALGFSLINRTVLIAPPGLPEEIRAKLEAAFKASVENPEVVKKVNALGYPIFFKRGPEAAKETREIYDRYGAIIKRLMGDKK